MTFTDRDNGLLVWGFRILLTAFAGALTIIATLSMSMLGRGLEAIDRIEGRLVIVEQRVAALKGDFITRDEARALHRAIEERVTRGLERERAYQRERHLDKGSP